LPAFAGVAYGEIKANGDEAFRRLIARFADFYAGALFNPHWGESVVFGTDNTLGIHLVFHDLPEAQAREIFKPFTDFIGAANADYTFTESMTIIAVPARRWWDPAYLAKTVPGLLYHDPRQDIPGANIWYRGDAAQAGWFIHGYESAWLPAGLLAPGRREQLAEMLFATSRHWHVALHFN